MKMIKVLILFLSLCVCRNSFSNDVQGILQANTDATYKMGDFFNSELILWPISIEQVTELKKLEGKSFLDFFHLVQIDKIYLSENNSEAVVLKMTLVASREVGEFPPVVILPIGSINIPVSVKLGKVEKSELTIKELLLWEPDLQITSNQKYVIGTGVILLLIGLVMLVILPFLRKKDEEKLKRKEIKKVRTKFRSILKKANNREDFELLILKTNFYSPFLQDDEVKLLSNLKRETRDVFYTKDWSDEEVGKCKKIIEEFLT